MDAEEHGDELRMGQAKKETEGFITAAQSQALRKNSKKITYRQAEHPAKIQVKCGERGL